MRFMLMTTDGGGGEGAPARREDAGRDGRVHRRDVQVGVLLATGGLEPHGTRITSSGGKVTVTDGPFAESKEGVVGFAPIEVRTREEAIELSRRFWQLVGDGEGVVKQVFGPEDAAPGA